MSKSILQKSSINHPKKPISYDEDKLIYTPIFSKDQLDYLEALNRHSNGDVLFSPRNIEAFSMEFAYASALLEGNTYSPVEAELLFTMGKIGGKKDLKETLMLKNMYESFGYLAQEVAQSKKGRANANPKSFAYLVKKVHAIAAKHLLAEDKLGWVGNEAILIGCRSYVPYATLRQLEMGLETIANEHSKIQNPFERAVYVHQSLSCLQYFMDDNQSVARNMCAYTLMAADKMPIMFTQRHIGEYAKAIAHYHESKPTDYSKFAQYFIASYEYACSRMNAHAVEQAKRDVGYLPNVSSQD